MNKPNVLYIMSDDHSANAISAYGSILSEVFKTPNIDRLYEEGTMCSNFFSTNAICTPARATIMTGQYGHVNGVRTLSDVYDSSKGPDLAKILQAAGYDTQLIGKWHLHSKPEGFNGYQVLSGGHGQGTYFNPEFDEEGSIVTHEGYVTDIITDKVLAYLDSRPKDQPFFMMCHHKAPHDFWEYAKRHENLFDGVEVPVPPSLFEDRSHRSVATRDYGSSVTPRSKVRSLYEDFQSQDYCTGPLIIKEGMTFEEKGLAAYQKYLKDYLRTVAAIDDSVGALLNKLEESGDLENTLIIYTSDQGMFLGEHDYQDKRWSYEESLRAPFLLRYPNSLPANHVNKNLIANTDVAPTILDFCGIDVPKAMQGVSQKEVLFKVDQADKKPYIYFRYWMHLAHRHHNPAHYGIRTQQYKLIYYYGLPLDANGAEAEPTPQGYELYDMLKDPQELCNVFDDPAYEDIQKDLLVQLMKAKEEVKDEDDLQTKLSL